VQPLERRQRRDLGGQFADGLVGRGEWCLAHVDTKRHGVGDALHHAAAIDGFDLAGRLDHQGRVALGDGRQMTQIAGAVL